MALDTIIEFENAQIFQKDNLILKDVNLSVSKGEFVYFIGKVGSGKTSLIKTMNAEIPLKEGEGKVVSFDLTKIKTKQVPHLRRKLGIVFQDFKLLTDRSVFENLQFVLKATGWKNKNEINDRIADVLERVGLSYKGYKMPHQLSGGEQQRVVIARALLNDPEIILADEPTGNLDPESGAQIIGILRKIRDNGRAVLMVTHNYSLIQEFPEPSLVIEEGKVTEQNHTQEIDFERLKE